MQSTLLNKWRQSPVSLVAHQSLSYFTLAHMSLLPQPSAPNYHFFLSQARPYLICITSFVGVGGVEGQGEVCCKCMQWAWYTTNMLPRMVQSKYMTDWQVFLAGRAVCLWNNTQAEIGWCFGRQVKRLWRLPPFLLRQRTGPDRNVRLLLVLPLWTEVVKLQCVLTGI